MSQQAVQEIFSNPDNQFLLGSDNLFNYKYQKQQAGDLMLNVRDSLYTNVRLDYITFQQTDDKKSVLNGGKLITFNIKNQPYGAIESLKYHFTVTNQTAANYTFSTVYNLLNYIEIFNNNKSVEKLDVNTLFLQNLIQVKQDSFALQNQQKGFNSSLHQLLQRYFIFLAKLLDYSAGDIRSLCVLFFQDCVNSLSFFLIYFIQPY